MTDLPDELTFNLEELPGWAIVYLDNVGLPRKLYPEIMSDDEKLAINAFAGLMQSVEGGFVEATVEDGVAVFQITEKGRKHVELRRKDTR